MQEVKWFGQGCVSGKAERQEREKDPFGIALVPGWVYVCCSVWSWSGDGDGVLQGAVKQLRFNMLQVLGQLWDMAASVLLVGAVLLLIERGKPKSRN